AEMLYVHLDEAPDPSSAAADALGAAYALPLSGHYFVAKRTPHDIAAAASGVAVAAGATAAGEETILSRSLWDEELPVAPLADAGRRTIRRPGPAGQTLLSHTRRFTGTDAEWTVTVAEDISGLDTAIARFRRVLLSSMLLALLALAWVQRAIVVHGLAPLARAVDACRKLERGETASVPGAAPDEVRPMLEAVDRLVHHQAQRLSRVRHAAGNLSHALKTPLAVLAQIADERESAGDSPAASAIREQVDSMRATIERELRRARLAGSGIRSEGFDARAQLQALAEALARLHAARGLRIDVVAPAQRLAFDREDMLELFGNLLDNACKWARTTVRVELAADDAALRFRVDDDGPGVDGALLDRLGRGTLRTDERRPGHGLGLTIVGDIVAQYRGAIEYRRSDTLGGLCVAGSLPRH
ncbi:MAG: sensor histidine kinase, partial [Burkholderiaceae bacterium]|nr:sensor histidine kinase [Burkholderiaceae bacterium]